MHGHIYKCTTCFVPFGFPSEVEPAWSLCGTVSFIGLCTNMQLVDHELHTCLEHVVCIIILRVQTNHSIDSNTRPVECSYLLKKAIKLQLVLVAHFKTAVLSHSLSSSLKVLELRSHFSHNWTRAKAKSAF